MRGWGGGGGLLSNAQNLCSLSFNYNHGQSVGKETALGPAAGPRGIDAQRLVVETMARMPL